MRNKVLVAVLAASAGWGLGGVGTRAAYNAGASTLTVLGIRSVVATLALGLFVIFVRPPQTVLAWKHGLLIGLVRTGLGPMLFMGSLNYISAGVEGLLITLIPATTALMAAITIHERITARQVLGLVVGLAGTLVIALSGDSGLGADGNLAAGLAFAGGGVIVGSISGVLQRHYAPMHDTLVLAMPMFVSGTALALVAGLAFRFDDVSKFDSDIWVLLIVLGLLSTLMPFGLTLYASKAASATVVGMTGYLAPLVAVIGGVVLLDEVVTTTIVVGAALTVIGVAMVGGMRRTPT